MAEARLFEEIEKMKTRIAKLEADGFDRRAAGQEAQRFQKQTKEGFKKASDSYAKLRDRVDTLAADIEELKEDFQNAARHHGSTNGTLATAPSAASWEAAKQAAELTRVRLDAAFRARVKEEYDDERLKSAHPPAQEDARPSVEKKAGSTNDGEDSDVLEDGEGQVIPDSQQHAQRVEVNHPSALVQYSFDEEDSKAEI